jgi:hypothetical protein
MVAATLWIEITLAGSFYVLGTGFLYCGVYRINNLHPVTSLNNLFPYFAFALIGLSYICGITVHRMTQILRREKKPLEQTIKDAALVHQYGTERLNRELDFQFGLRALFRSLWVSLPWVWACLAFWSWRVGTSMFWGRSGFFLVLLPVIWGMVVLVNRRQRESYRIIAAAAQEECRRERFLRNREPA